MAKLVIIKNPFQVWNGRQIKNIPEGFTIRQAVNMTEFKDLEINCVVDGKTIDIDEYYIIPNDSIVTLCPVVAKGGGKSILGLVAVVALSVVAMGVGGMAAGGAWGTAGWTMAGANMTLGYLAAAAVMFVGSTLIGRFIGTSTVDTNLGSYENDATYSWNGVETTEGQNNPITMTYGKVKSAGQTIGKFVNVSGNDEYLNWLISAGEGPLTISNIQLNDNPISYYSGVNVETREGINNQSVISNFNDTYFTKSLGYQLLDGYRTDTCQSNATQGIIVKIEFSNGLYYANDNGNLSTAWVDVYAEYRIKNGSWTPFWYGNFKSANNLPSGVTLVDTSDEHCPVGNFTFQYKYYYDSEGDDYYYVVIRYPNGVVKTGYVDYGDTETIGVFKVSYVNRGRGEYTYTATVSYYTAPTSVRISGAQSSALRREYRKDGLAAGEYEVRIHVTGRSHSVTNSRASVRCYWSSLTSIVYDDFSYPNIALIGIKALATDQISGTPSLTFIKERSKVWVFNPATNSYEQKNANNPAWASYDMLHLASRLYNINTGKYEFDVRGVPANHIIYEHFKEWADFCDNKRLYVNIEVTQASEMLDCINSNLANCGRGMVVRFGTRYGCIFECAKQPVQMFNMGNIIAGTLKEEFLATNDRANCVEIIYNDAEQDYSRNVITIYGENYDSDAEEKTAQATYNGITSYSQAYREGMYQLYCNKYQLRTVTFEANIDAIACTIGDVILVSHDVPMWANSGRIYEVNVEENTLLLPIEIENVQGAYRVMYRTINDVLYTSDVSIISNANGWCKVKLNVAFNRNDLPQANDIFDIARNNIGSKPFIVKAITRAQDFTRNITCLEYNENLYNENYSIPPVQYSVDNNKRPKNVTGLNAKQTTYKDASGTTKSLLSVSWVIPDNGGSFTVLYSKDNKKYSVLRSGVQGAFLDIDVEYGNDYYVKVITTLGASQSSGVIVGPVEVGEDVIPPDIKLLDTELLSNGTRRFWWDFDYPNPNDIAGFKLKYLQGNLPTWSAGFELHTGLITHQPFETNTLRQGTHTVMIKAVDYNGQESKNAIYTVINLGDLLEENVLSHDDVSRDNWGNTFHNGVVTGGVLSSRSNVAFWSAPKDVFWTSKNKEFWLERYAAFAMAYQYISLASGQFWLNYDIEGPAQILYLICGKDDFWVSPTTSFWSFAEDLFWKVNDNKQLPYAGKTMIKAGEQIQISVVSSENVVQSTKIKSMDLIIDVPDREEHFENIVVPETGIRLDIKTPNYYTTSVRIDAIQGTGTRVFRAIVLEKNPCKVQIVDIDYSPISAIVDLTWQGYEKELI